MNTKLTLSVEKSIIDSAKMYAKKTGKSLSEIIQNYLEKLTLDEEVDNNLSSKLNKIVGSVELPKDFNEKEELKKYMENKHL
jgi:ABC-type phosphate transport system ATPase subunit